MSATIGCVVGNWSWRYAHSLRASANVTHASVYSVACTDAYAPMNSAKDSFNHKSSHHRMVTRSPNHMWDISCNSVFARPANCARVAPDGNRYASVNVTSPGFSMAPRLYSGTNACSYFPNGYANANNRGKKSRPCLVSVNSSWVSMCSASARRQYKVRGMVTASPWGSVPDHSSVNRA